MASYYTYGEMPSAESTVYGGGLDDDRFYTPRDENVPIAPLGGQSAAPYSGSRAVPNEGYPTGTIGSLYVPGATIPEGVDPLAQIDLSPEQIKSLGNAMALAGLVDPKAFGNFYVGDVAFGGGPISTGDYYRNLAKGAVGGQGSFYEEGALERARAEAQDPYAGLFGENLRELVAADPSLQGMIEAKTARGLEQIGQVEQDYEVMKPLSDLLKANKFEEAFAYAKANNVTDRLLKADWLAQLRQPFSDEEQQKFYNAIPPDIVGKGWIYDPQNAMKRSFTAKGTTPQWMGYPDPGAAFKPKEDKTFEKIAMAAGLAMLTAGLAPAFAGASGAAGAAGGAGGAGAAGAGAGAAGAGAAGAAGAGAAGGTGFLSGLQAAGRAVLGIPEAIGKTVATQLGAGGLSPVYNKMIGNAVISGGVTGAKGGKLEDVLKSAALAAGLTYVSDKVISSVAQKLQDSRLLEAAKDIPGGDVAAVDPTVASNIVNNVSQGLENFAGEFGVTTFAPSAAASGLQTLGAVGAAQAATPTAEAKPSEQYASDEDLLAGEITIGAEAPNFGAGLETGAYTGYKLASDQGVGAEPETGFASEEELAKGEIGISAPRQDITDIFTTVPALSDVFREQTGYKKPVFEETPLDEVIVRAEQLKPIDIKPDIANIANLIPALSQQFKDPFKYDKPITEETPIEEIVVKTDRLKPIDVGSGLANIPALSQQIPKEPFEVTEETVSKEKDVFKTLLEKYGTLENLLKVIGSLGAAGAGGARAPTGGAGAGTGAGGMGGALPKYTYTRQQLSPDIDYYSYGTRPEAKFFEYGLQLEKPEQPAAPPAPDTGIRNPEEEPVFASGGLTGYAKGGSKSSRYVDGPGSGRDDKIPALLSDGEYVIDAETLALLGDGSTKEGARRMDKFRANIRQHKGRALSRGRISPNAKSPDKYMGGGLT